MGTRTVRIVHQLQKELRSRANPSDARKIYKYMKGVLPCMGLKAPAIEDAVRQWRQDNVVSDKELRQVGYCIFRQDMMEEKLAGCIAIKAGLRGRHTIDALHELEEIHALFDEDVVVGWAVCDSLSCKIISRLIKLCHDGALPDCLCSWPAHMRRRRCVGLHWLHRHRCGLVPRMLKCSSSDAKAQIVCHMCTGSASPSPRQVVDYLWKWTTSENEFQVRAALVPFVSLAAKPPLYPGMQEDLMAMLQTTIQRPERFIQLATGVRFAWNQQRSVSPRGCSTSTVC
jgi:DNA alkylation repair enzyme